MTNDPLVEHALAIAALAEAAAAVAPRSAEPRERVRQLNEHLRSFVLPRARSLDAPLVVLLFGPTGAGKSSLANAIAGVPLSPTGVLRPTTREAIALATAGDRDALLRGAFAELPAGAISWRLVDWTPGVCVVDAPDIDSVETANRELADRLIEAADMAAFVTTATRYADQVPWTVLRRVAARRLPLIVVVNRLPADDRSRAEVLGDVRRLLGRAALVGADEAARLTVVPVDEGEVELAGTAQSALSAAAAAPLVDRIDTLRGDAAARRRLAARSLAGALAGLEPLLQSVADDLDREAIDADALRRAAEGAYRGELSALRDQLKTGLVLRSEVLRRWQDYVGADRLTRSISSAMTRAEAAVRSAFRRGPDAPVVAVREEMRAELSAIAEARASEAARRSAAAWTDTPGGAMLVEHDPGLWTASPGFRTALALRLDAWLAAIESSIASTGASKRRMAVGAATGVNAAGVGVMLAVFLHTGGLTGAEMGVAAGTAVLNQRLLQAIFGEAAIVRLVDDAARRLDALLVDAFDEDARRFVSLVPDTARLRELAGELRRESATVAGAVPVEPGGGIEPGHATSIDVEDRTRVRTYTTQSRGLLDAIRDFLRGERTGG